MMPPMGVPWEAWLLAALAAAAVVAAAPASSIWRARRRLRERVRDRLLPDMGNPSRDLAAEADDGETVVFRGRLRVTGAPAERYEDGAPVAVAVAVCALSPSQLIAFDDRQVDERAGQGLELDVDGDRMTLVGPMRVRAGDERRPAPSIDEIADALRDEIDADLSERGREVLALRSIPDGAEVVVRGRVERAPATSQRSGYRSAPTKWVIVPAEDDGALVVAQIAPTARESWTLSRFAPGLLVAAVLLWLAPDAIDQQLSEVASRANSAASACLEAYDRGDVELEDCLSKGDGVAMVLLGMLPSYADKAENARTRIRRRAARRLLTRATEIEPRSAARAEAAERYLTLMGGESAESMRDLFAAGAFAFVAANGRDALAFEAAVATADVERAKVLALAIAGDADARLRAIQAMRVGAWLCLTGERPRGVTFLEGWLDRVAIDHERNALLLAMAACGGEGIAIAQRFLDPMQLEYLRSVDPGYEAGRRRALFRTLAKSLYPDSRHHVIAASHLGGEQEPPYLDALGLAHPSYGGQLFPRKRSYSSAITAAHWKPEIVYFDVVPPAAALTVAARRLDKLADDPPEMPEGRDGWPFASDKAAIESPGPALAQAAWTLWLEAAVEHVRRGDREAAKKALARADALAPPTLRWMNAAAHLAADDANGALEMLKVEAAQEDRTVRTSMLLFESQALAMLGRHDQAYAVAKRAFEASEVKDHRAESYSEEGARQLLAAYQLAATALLADRVAEALTLLDLGVATGDVISDFAQPGLLLGFAKDGLGDDVPYWVASPGIWPPLWVWRGLLTGRALARGHDVEVALDRAWSDEHRQKPGLAAWARWQAARLRGDQDAEKRWAERCATLAELVAGDTTGVLAQVAGL
jgi:hypothetical protein